jgi:hypothetical protein
LDEGPFFETGAVTLDDQTTDDDDMIIQGAPGVRPIIIADIETSARKWGMLYLRKHGNLTVRDLILLPPVAGVVDQATYEAKVAETGIAILVDSAVNTSITLENIFIGSNNGNNQPTSALDGLTPPVVTPETVSFRDEGIVGITQNTVPQHYLYFENIVVTGLDGDQGSDGIRGFPDGAPGSRWIIGPGTVISYNEGHGFQPGGTDNFSVEVRGEEDNPVKIINNGLSGIHVTNTPGVDAGLTHVEWCIIANNGLHGINHGDVNTGTLFTNVTIANNGGNVFLGPSSANAVTYTFSNVIAAGDGDPANPDNVIRLTGTGTPSFFTATNSALVLEGPYTMNNTLYGADGIDSGPNYTVTPTTTIIDDDPQFVSLNPAGPGFAVVTNQAYGTAGPAGQPIVGGGSLAPASVEDWQLF